MLPKQRIEELISCHYVSALIARSGYVPQKIEWDFGIDLEVRRIKIDGTNRIDLGAFLSFQLKASIDWELEDDHVVYDMEASAYNRLIVSSTEGTLPVALVLLCLPRDETEWLNACEDYLVVKRCCYYHFLDGNKTENVRSIRLRIPRVQLLTPDTIELLKQQQFGGLLT